MRQYATWVNSLAATINSYFKYLYSINIQQSSSLAIQHISKRVNWLCDFRCLLTHNQLPASAQTSEYIRYHSDRIRFNHTMVTHFEGRLPTDFNANRWREDIARQHETEISTELLRLVDYAAHNSHTFDSKAHMYQALYLLKNIAAGACTIQHSDLCPLIVKERIAQNMVIIHQRIVQISNIRYMNIVARIKPTFINYGNPSQYQL